MTLEAWVRPATGGSAWQTVLLKEQPGDLVYALYAAAGGGRPAAHVYVGGDDERVGGPAELTAGIWTHLAATYDGASLRVYRDGTVVANRALTGAMPASAGPLRIGGTAVWNEWFSGQIDEVRIYDRALSAAEIAADRDRPLGTG